MSPLSPQGTPESPELIGTQIGNYRLSRLLGGGSMGAVYEAVHNQISRRVAVKVLHAHLSQDPEQRSRFLNEARAVSRVQHPGLIQIYDCGELPGGQIYIIMEFLEGAQLADRLQTAEPLPQGESLRIVHGMAQALAAAHQAGIIHRDLKPENVMLLGAPAVGTATADKVKVLDFGIAKILQSQVDARQTAPGSVLGTPLYMSPEQCVGNLVTDPRADVYALGVMLYELVAGRRPFRGPTPMDVLVAVMSQKVEGVDELPGGLGRIVERALCKRAEERFQTAGEMAAALDGLGSSGEGQTGRGATTDGGSVYRVSEASSTTSGGGASTSSVRSHAAARQVMGNHPASVPTRATASPAAASER